MERRPERLLAARMAQHNSLAAADTPTVVGNLAVDSLAVDTLPAGSRRYLAAHTMGIGPVSRTAAGPPASDP